MSPWQNRTKLVLNIHDALWWCCKGIARHILHAHGRRWWCHTNSGGDVIMTTSQWVFKGDYGDSTHRERMVKCPSLYWMCMTHYDDVTCVEDARCTYHGQIWVGGPLISWIDQSALRWPHSSGVLSWARLWSLYWAGEALGCRLSFRELSPASNLFGAIEIKGWIG